MRRAAQPASRGGARRRPRVTGAAASTAAKRLHTPYRPVEEAKV